MSSYDISVLARCLAQDWADIDAIAVAVSRSCPASCLGSILNDGEQNIRKTVD